MESIRTCTKCALEAFTRDDLEEFCKDSRAPYGRSNKCKKCHAAQYRSTDFKEKPSLDSGVEPLRECNSCHIKAYTKEDLGQFQYAKGALFGRANLCRKCASTKTINNKKPIKCLETHRKNQRKYHLKKAYGLTLKEFGIMLKEQNNCCKICGCEAFNERNAFREHLVVDHCHDTGVVRGLLCAQCNIGLGSFADNLELVANAKSYLKETQA